MADSYAQQFGARPATRAEKVARGFKPGTRAYTMADGEVVSHRRLQTMGLQRKYSGITDSRRALEERARLRSTEMGIRSPRKTFDRMLHNFATAPVEQGGLGAGYQRGKYVLPNGERIGKQEVARLPEFRDREIGTWAQWQRIRHTKGPQGQRIRFNFLNDLGFFEEYEPGHWRYIGSD